MTNFKTGQRRKPPSHDAGRQWFGMRGTPLTAELQKDLTLIRHRNYLDPKRFYKSSDTPSTFVQAGTVIEGAAEFYASRLTKKQRQATLVQEVLADPSLASYAQEKFKKMGAAKRAAAEQRSKRYGKKSRR